MGLRSSPIATVNKGSTASAYRSPDDDMRIRPACGLSERLRLGAQDDLASETVGPPNEPHLTV